MVKGLLPSFISLFLNRKSNRIVFNSEFNENFNHCSKHLFLYFINKHKHLECKFLINNEELKNELSLKYGDYFITSKGFKNTLYILRASTWVTSSLETPIGGLFLSFRRNVFHLGHGAPLKAIGLGESYVNPFKSIYYRLIRTNFTYFVSTSEVFDSAWRKCLNLNERRILRGAQCRNDLILNPDVKALDLLNPNKRTTVIYAPTWRPFCDTKLFPFDDFEYSELNDFLIKNQIQLFLRLHPNFQMALPEELLNMDNIALLSKDKVEDINTILGGFDLLITDYSSIYIDYLNAFKPILFLPYDFDEYNRKIGFSIDYERYTPGPKPCTSDEFFYEIMKLLEDKNYYGRQRENVHLLLNSTTKRHTEKTANLICNISRL